MRHDEIVEHVSSILKSNGIAHSGESIDTGKLEWFDIYWLYIYSVHVFVHIIYALIYLCFEATNMVGGCRLASQIHKEVCFILVDPISY